MTSPAYYLQLSAALQSFGLCLAMTCPAYRLQLSAALQEFWLCPEMTCPGQPKLQAPANKNISIYILSSHF
jgi:hypothetical protein